MQNIEQIVHNFTDLEAWYNRKLANACGVLEEVAGVGTLAIKLFTNVTQRFEHCIHNNFGISEESCGGRHDPVGGLG